MPARGARARRHGLCGEPARAGLRDARDGEGHTHWHACGEGKIHPPHPVSPGRTGWGNCAGRIKLVQTQCCFSQGGSSRRGDLVAQGVPLEASLAAAARPVRWHLGAGASGRAPAAVPTPAAAGGAAPLPLLSLVGKLAPQVHARARACVGERTKVASFLLHRHATLVLVRVPVVAVFARQLSLGRLHVELFGPCRLQSASSRPVPLWHFLTMAAARFKSRNLVDCAPAT